MVHRLTEPVSRMNSIPIHSTAEASDEDVATILAESDEGDGGPSCDWQDGVIDEATDEEVAHVLRG